MPDLHLDTDVARDCGQALRHVQAELKGIESISDHYADLVGHRGLADKVRSFVGNQDDTRREIEKAIVGLGDAGVAIADSLDGVDAALTKALLGAMGSEH